MRGVRRTHHGQQGPKRFLVGNTETMKGMGRAGSGEREAERSRNSGSHQPSAAAQTNGCAQEKQKLKQNVLDGADFVRDVINSYSIPANICFTMCSRTLGCSGTGREPSERPSSKR